MENIFISYANLSPDTNIASGFYHFFKNHGLNVFMSNESIKLGERWSERITNELNNCNYFFILLSANSIKSDMVTEELRRAKELYNKHGSPIIFPVRLNLGYDETFNYEISGYLNRIQQKLWKNNEDTTKIGNEVLQIIVSKRDNLINTDNTPKQKVIGFDFVPTENTPLEVPGGCVALNSPFYIVREGEEEFVQQILWTGALLKIKGPKQFGKSSLMARVNKFALNHNHRIVALNLERMNENTLQNLSSLLMQICHYMSTTLKLPSKVKEYWADDWIDVKIRCFNYIEDEILAKIDDSIVFALDSVDQLFDYKDVSNEFFSLLRVFHEESKNNDLWTKFKLVITHARDGNLAVTNLNQSPFNVGLEYCLNEFSLDQISKLVNIYQLDLNEVQINDFILNIGCHPFISRKALYDLKTGKYSFDLLKSNASTEDGPFGDHLQRQYWKLTQYPKVLSNYFKLIKSQPIDDEMSLSILRASGLVKGHGNKARTAYKIYNDFFSTKFIIT